MDDHCRFISLSILAGLLLFLPSFCVAASKLFIISSPELSRVYVNSEFVGVFSSEHEKALEINLSPGIHTVEAIKVTDENKLLYFRDSINIEQEQWNTIYIELTKHPESNYIDLNKDNPEDFITALPQTKQKGRITKTTQSFEKQPPIELLPLTDSQVHRWPNALDEFAIPYLREKNIRHSNELKTRIPNIKIDPNVLPEMVKIPAGEFCQYTESECEPKPIKSFYLASKEVTIGLWLKCSLSGYCKKTPNSDTATDKDQAMYGISMTDAREFIRWLKSTTKKPVRLPTDLEWLYAAYAARETVFPWGDIANSSMSHCNTNQGPEPPDHPGVVGQFPPNDFGLYDIVGNVAELTSNYSLRGGSWLIDCDKATIDYAERVKRYDTRRITSGLRIAMSSDPSSIESSYFCVDERGIGRFLDVNNKHFGSCFTIEFLEKYIKQRGLK